jgi:hypothetical protein
MVMRHRLGRDPIFPSSTSGIRRYRGGGRTPVTITFKDASGNNVNPPPGSILGIGARAIPDSVDLVDH